MGGAGTSVPPLDVLLPPLELLDEEELELLLLDEEPLEPDEVLVLCHPLDPLLDEELLDEEPDDPLDVELPPRLDEPPKLEDPP
jgi:hypothetical protein